MAAAVAGNFETQAREAFRQLDLALNRAGGSLADMVPQRKCCPPAALTRPPSAPR
ncbi:MAG TPA: hypothetical protein VKC66_09425 [Xanthobacteraceae bacterium]|nr:hypothetical protein [Xanthobacteraceae bacterium]